MLKQATRNRTKNGITLKEELQKGAEFSLFNLSVHCYVFIPKWYRPGARTRLLRVLFAVVSYTTTL